MNRSAARSRKAPSSNAWALLLCAALLETGCMAHTAPVGSEVASIGRVQVTSTRFGNIALTPIACASGEHHLFMGADFLDTARGTVLRLIVEPAGEATLRVFDTARPLDPGIVVRRTACSRFLVSLERTGWRINDIYDLRVSLDVDCRTASGDALQGKLSVARCH